MNQGQFLVNFKPGDEEGPPPVCVGKCFVGGPRRQHRANTWLVHRRAERRKGSERPRSFPPRPPATMWLSWDKLKSVGFSCIFACWPCSQMSSQFTNAPISISLVNRSSSVLFSSVLGEMGSVVLGRKSFAASPGVFYMIAHLPPSLTREPQEGPKKVPRTIWKYFPQQHI